MGKRLFDLAGAVAILGLTAPLFLLALIGIALGSPGPVFYRAARVGRHGREFRMYKFRTMRLATDEPASVITAAGDRRIFPFGAFLRKTKIDELPQLFNVLRGDMALIGPRPEDPSIVRRWYTPLQMETLEVRPGVASPGSIFNYTHGEAMLDAAATEEKYGREVLPVKLALDLYYVRHASAAYDIRIVLRTLWVVVQTLAGRRSFPQPREMAACREARLLD